MRINRLRVKEFRSLKDFNLELDETTVIIGENNSGKTSLLDALRLTLSHRWGLRGTGFEEYDFHLSKDQDDPKHCPSIRIEIDFEEAKPNEWHEGVIADLQGMRVLQAHPVTGLNKVTVRAEFLFSAETELFEPTWCFVNEAGDPITTPRARSTNLINFFDYVPVFSLSALRDAEYEFSNKSQFWGKLIKSINIKDDEWKQISKQLEELNKKLLKADPKFTSIKEEIEKLIKIMPPGSVDAIDLRALPLRIWDLIAKTELLLKSSTEDPWLPLSHFGQGVQSLAVINVFRAFVNDLLAEDKEQRTPILLLEEPESHLHPQAIRALYQELVSVRGQKVITTHSPYFLQNVPFEQIRLLRKVGGLTVPFFVRREVREPLENNEALKVFVKKHKASWSYDEGTKEIVVRARIDEDKYRELLTCYTTQADRATMHPRIKTLREQSLDHIAQDDLLRLEDSAKRIRGDIFFARKWLFTEGQSDYVVLTAMAPLVIGDLDNHAIAVIDCQNNGPVGAFVSLARTFGFPWAVLCDGDQGGDDYLENIKKQRFSQAFLDAAVTRFGEGKDLEKALAKSLPDEVTEELLKRMLVYPNSGKPSQEQVAELLAKNNSKLMTALKIREMIKEGKIVKAHIPAEVVRVLEYIKTATAYK